MGLKRGVKKQSQIEGLKWAGKLIASGVTLVVRTSSSSFCNVLVRQEAIKAREGLEQSLAIAIHRYTYYEKQLGKKDSEIQIPQLDALGSGGLEKLKFKATEPDVKLRSIEANIAQNLGASGGENCK